MLTSNAHLREVVTTGIPWVVSFLETFINSWVLLLDRRSNLRPVELLIILGVLRESVHGCLETTPHEGKGPWSEAQLDKHPFSRLLTWPWKTYTI